MKKGLLLKIFKINFRLIYLLLALTFLTLATYFFGYNLLRFPLSGSDSANDLTFIRWIDRFFPQVPLWWPQQGSGVSFVRGYPTFYHFLVVVLSRIFPLTLTQAMGAVNFAAVFFVCWGIYFLVWWRFKSQTAALIASFFYLLSPISYLWNNRAGFLAQTFSWVFIPPALAFFDWYFSLIGKKGKEGQKIFACFGVVVFTILAMLSHPITGLGLVMIYSFYFFFSWLLGKNKKKILKQLILPYFLLIVAVFLMAAFWFVPFVRYFSWANRNFFAYVTDINVLPRLNFLSFLNITKWDRLDMDGWFFVKAVWIPALLGVFLGLMKKNKRISTWGLVAIVAFIATGSYLLWKIFFVLGPRVAEFFTLRYFVGFSIIMIPVLAGLFFAYFWETVFSFTPKTIQALLVSFLAIVSMVLVVYFTNFTSPSYQNRNTLYYGPLWIGEIGEIGIDTRAVWNRPPRERCKPGSSGYAAVFCDNPAVRKHLEVNTLVRFCDYYYNVETRQPEFCRGVSPATSLPWNEDQVEEFWQKCQQPVTEISLADICLATAKGLSSQLKRWPRPFLDVKKAAVVKEEKIISSFVKPDSEFFDLSKEGYRLDISPSLGAWIKLWNVYADSFLVNVYTGMLSLNKPYQSFFIDAFYSDQGIYDQFPRVLDSLAGYFGVGGVIVARGDPEERFESAGWEKKIIGEKGWWWRAPQSYSLLTLTRKPTVLVIGQEKKRSYEAVFRLANLGALPYEQAILVKGRETGFIDEYTFEDLRQFDLIVLYGYRYKDIKRSWRALENYVKQGGSLWIETGWQYASQDWQAETTPSIFPIRSLNWQDLGKTGSYQLEREVGGEINVADFSPLIWKDQSWGVSSNNRQKLRDWAEPVLSVGDFPLVARGNFAKGKVVWLGMNLFAHAFEKQNQEEIKFISKLFNWLLAGKWQPRDDGDLKAFFSRDNPDRVEIYLQEDSNQMVTLLWRESFHPHWQATLVGQGEQERLFIHRGGPEFMLIRLGPVKKGEMVILEFKEPIVEKIASLISVATLFTLIFLLADSLIFKGKTIKLVKERLVFALLQSELIKKGRGIGKRLKSWWEEEEI